MSLKTGARRGRTGWRASSSRRPAASASAQPVASRKPASTSLGKCQPSETTEKPTVSASAAPTIAAAGRARRGAAKTAASASAMAAVECPLGSASTPTCPPPIVGCRRGYASSSLSSWLETLVRASSSTIRIATRGRPRATATLARARPISPTCAGSPRSHRCARERVDGRRSASRRSPRGRRGPTSARRRSRTRTGSPAERRRARDDESQQHAGGPLHASDRSEEQRARRSADRTNSETSVTAA